MKLMARKKRKKILIFIPTYNHRKTIIPTIERIPKSIFQEVSELLIADDASKDNTAEIVSEYIKKNKEKNKNLKKLKIIKHKKNKGYGGNQKWAYQYAIDNGFDIVAMLHGDLQYAPEELPNLLNPLKNDEADFVFGSRMTGAPLKGGMPIYKFIGNKFLTFIENLILKTKFSEFHSGYRIYSTQALKDIPFQKASDGYYFDSEIIIQLIRAKKRITERTIPTHYGDEKCYVWAVPYGLQILRLLGQYLLHINHIKKYGKFDVRKHKI